MVSFFDIRVCVASFSFLWRFLFFFPHNPFAHLCSFKLHMSDVQVALPSEVGVIAAPLIEGSVTVSPSSISLPPPPPSNAQQDSRKRKNNNDDNIGGPEESNQTENKSNQDAVPPSSKKVKSAQPPPSSAAQTVPFSVVASDNKSNNDDDDSNNDDNGGEGRNDDVDNINNNNNDEEENNARLMEPIPKPTRELPPVDLSQLSESDVLARIYPGAVIKQLIDSIKDIVDNANFRFTSSGLSMQTMDSSHVSLVSLFLDASAFAPYHVRQDRALGLSKTSIVKINKFVGKDDIITISASAEGDKVEWRSAHPSNGRNTQISFSLMDIDGDEIGIPAEDFQCIVRLPSTRLRDTIKEMKQMGDTIRITVTPDAIEFQSKGDDGVAKIQHRRNELPTSGLDVDGGASLENDDEVLIQMNGCENDSFTQLFALKYLNDFCRGCSCKLLGKFVTLKMAADRPIMVEYTLAEARGTLQFYLAPKLAEDGSSNDE